MTDAGLHKPTNTVTGQSLARTLLEYLHGSENGSVAYSGKGWIAASEVTLQHRDGGRVDVLAARKSWSNFELRAHEIKISRADFFADVNAGKYRRYLTACHTVVFVTPKGLVQTSEVPADAGHLTFDPVKCTWRMARKPPACVGRPELLDERTMLALAMAVDDRRSSQLAQLRAPDRERDAARHKLLGKKHGKVGLTPADFDDESLLDWAMSRAGWSLAQEVRDARNRARIYDDLIAALIEAGIVPPTYGDEGVSVMRDAAERIKHVVGVSEHLRSLAALASHVSNRLAGVNHERRDPEKLLGRVDETDAQLTLLEARRAG